MAFPTEPGDIPGWRDDMAGWEQAALERIGPMDESLEEYSDSITLPDGRETQLKVIRPKAHLRQGNKPPLIMLVHGGGFYGGTIQQLTRPGREFAKQFGAVVVLSTHRMAPEHPFPTQFHDCWDTMAWVASHATERFGAYPEQGFVVGGTSAGAHVTAVLAQQACERGFTPAITGSFLTVPLLLVEEIVPDRYRKQWTAREENTAFPPTANAEHQKWRRILNFDVQSPLFSPFNVSASQLKGLPRTYIQVGGLDPLRDDGLLYGRLLQENGVETRIDNYADLGHMSWCVFADESVPEDLAPKTMAGMAWLLRRE